MGDNFLPEEAVWEEGIRQIETTDTVLGGPSGTPNIAPGQLANRTKFLKEKFFDNGQFLEYNADRKYKTGDVCYTFFNDEIQYWQWYSNVESLAGKSPLLEANRHADWSDNTKPFYWIPYTGDQVGMPFYWLDTSAPEWAVMEINVDLPIAVYWRLARRYPSLVFERDGVSYINTGDIRGEFIRVADLGRGIDVNRQINSHQMDALQGHTHACAAPGRTGAGGGPYSGVINQNARTSGPKTDGTNGHPRVSHETRGRNIARSMAIII